MRSKRLTLALALSCLACMASVQAQEDAPGAQPKKSGYSPYPEVTYPNRVYFAATRICTPPTPPTAGMIGNTLGPEEAYRFAKGQHGQVVDRRAGAPGAAARLPRRRRPRREPRLAPLLMARDPGLMATEFGKELRKRVDAGDLRAAWDYWSRAKASGKDPLAGQDQIYRTAWQKITDAAEKHNEPGRFTAFIGLRVDVHLRRNKPAPQRDLPRRQRRTPTRLSRSPPTTRSIRRTCGSGWRPTSRKTDEKLLAIPHNGNLSKRAMSRRGDSQVEEALDATTRNAARAGSRCTKSRR